VITGEHTFIRGTEQDDVPALSALYRADTLRAGLLDGRREPVLPTRDELRELLSRKEIADGGYYTVEDKSGTIQGFCSLRGMNSEARYAEFSLVLLDPAYYARPLAAEAATFLFDRAFTRSGLRKVVAYCLEGETELAAFLRNQGFESAGVQRDVVYAGGRWHALEALARSNGSRNTA
jgi:RimJ/RimL family protein N-acetyltransferase